MNHTTHQGFTLVEVLVALALLTVALIPVLIQATDALRLSVSIQHSLISASMAQEGVEVVRAMRDANWFAGQPFDAGISACAEGCRVQWDSLALLPLGGNPPLRFDTVSGMYQYDSGDASPFARQITVTKVSAVELAVMSIVTWRERGVDKTFTVESHLFDWLKPEPSP